MSIKRRDLIAAAGSALATATAPISNAAEHVKSTVAASFGTLDGGDDAIGSHDYNGRYSGSHLERIAFPLGGIGAGMVCLEGAGALSKISVRHGPELGSEAPVFAALSIKGTNFARVLEGPISQHKRFPIFTEKFDSEVLAWWGLPRFRSAAFTARFPFAEVNLSDEDSPLDVQITGWSPFEPGQEDDACLPVAGLEYTFTNRSSKLVSAVFSFNAANFMGCGHESQIRPLKNGFILDGAIKEKPWTKGAFAVSTTDPATMINHAWFRGFSSKPMVWKDIAEAACYARPPLAKEVGESAPGATLFVPFLLAAGESKTIPIFLGWHVPRSNIRLSGGGVPDRDWVKRRHTLEPPPDEECYRPWYVSRYTDVVAVMTDWRERYVNLRASSQRFMQTLFSSTLPPEIIEAVAANLSILKSPTVLRQIDGRFWGWEGCYDDVGSCEGSCTHVWNYAQALPHLFPRLERSLRETEFGPNQNEEGHQAFRSALPIRPTSHDFVAVPDGQLGGIIRTYRDWRINGDTVWLKGLWPKVRASLEYCVRTWDPHERGWIEEPHHNTYDSNLWGPDGMCTSIYIGALMAAKHMGAAVNDDISRYDILLKRAVQRMENELFNGDYFQQKIVHTGLRARYPEDYLKGNIIATLYPEELAIALKEGPANQYGAGCLSDGVLGAWIAWACGLEIPLDKGKITSHLAAVHRHNFKTDLTAFAAPTLRTSRATYGLGTDAGLLLCTWPRGGKLSVPFPYASEVWTGIEYQVASHLMAHGKIKEGLEIVRACRKRYDGATRNPFSEVEAGHWYARAMSSYALLQALSGASYDAVDKILHLKPTIKGDFRSFISTAGGYGTVGVADGKPFLDVVYGEIPFLKISYTAP